MVRFDVDFKLDNNWFNLKFNDESTVNVVFGAFQEIESRSIEVYTDQTTVTPTVSEQVLNTSGKKLINDIIIRPIPSNFGKIIWNGSEMRIE